MKINTGVSTSYFYAQLATRRLVWAIQNREEAKTKPNIADLCRRYMRENALEYRKYSSIAMEADKSSR